MTALGMGVSLVVWLLWIAAWPFLGRDRRDDG
jgi:hypothetical protein